MTGWSLVPAASLRPEPWRNGFGTSRTIAAEHGDHGLLWMVGIADLVQDAPFSHYPGIDRVFTPIEGGVPALSFRGGPFEPCPLLVPKPFPGDIPTASRIPAPGRAFNALAERGRFSIAVRVLHPGDTAPLAAMGATVIHCLQGGASIADLKLGPGDSLVGTWLGIGHGTTSAPPTLFPDTILLLATFTAAP